MNSDSSGNGIALKEAEEDPDIFTEFETEDGPCGDTSPDGLAYWGAYCPQPDCGELQLFRGDPSEFAYRPYRCEECGWVSLMHGSVKEIKVIE